jgi:hypothetical protein
MFVENLARQDIPSIIHANARVYDLDHLSAISPETELKSAEEKNVIAYRV